MTESARTFVQRNSWFTYQKQEIYDRLKSDLNVPKVLHISGKNKHETFSEALAALDHTPSRVVAKHLRGHSTHEVRVLDLTKWPRLAFDILHEAEYTETDLDTWYASSGALLEEALCTEAEPIPLDFKVYWREGKPRIVAIVDRNKGRPRFSFLDAASWLEIPWSEIFEAGIPNRLWDPGPRMTDSIAERAEEAASITPRVAELINCYDLFMGVDCYVVNSKVYLGELTPRPGAMHMPWLRPRFIKKLLID